MIDGTIKGFVYLRESSLLILPQEDEYRNERKKQFADPDSRRTWMKSRARGDEERRQIRKEQVLDEAICAFVWRSQG